VRKFELGSALALILLILAATAARRSSAEDLPVCNEKALQAAKGLLTPTFHCEDSDQYCSSDKAMRWDEPECRNATTAYENTLKGILTPRWWAVPPSSLEACRVHGKVGTLTKDEAQSLNLGRGPQVQGTDRVRMLVIGATCEGSGRDNLFLVVRTGSIALTALWYDFNPGGTEAPYSLDVATDRLGTFAFFTSQGHDMQSAYSTTTVYKIDPITGYAALYPLLLTAQGTSAVIGNSEPVISELNFKDSEMVRNGRLVKQFLRYTDNLCQPGDEQCQPVATTQFTWNGKVFVESGYDGKRKKYLAELTRERQCIKQKFDAKKGTADCATDFECPKYNDLSLLNLKAGNLGEARNYAEGALDFCRSNFTEFQAAQYNYRQSHKAR
jgi:hypothetical protein